MATTGRVTLIHKKTSPNRYELLVSDVIPSDAYWSGWGREIVMDGLEKYHSCADMVEFTTELMDDRYRFDNNFKFNHLKNVSNIVTLLKDDEENVSPNKYVDYNFIKNYTDETVYLSIKEYGLFALSPKCILILEFGRLYPDDTDIPYQYTHPVDYQTSLLYLLDYKMKLFQERMRNLESDMEEMMMLLDDATKHNNDDE